jgi:dCMP deaminase
VNPGERRRAAQEYLSERAVTLYVTREPLNKWDQRGLQLARTVAGWSSCTRDNVGAVLMSPDHDVISTGFNDTPRYHGNCGDGGCLRAQRTAPSGSPQLDDEFCLHAEDNALQRAGLAARGATLYVTREPCAPCSRRAQTAGIARVVVASKESSPPG